MAKEELEIMYPVDAFYAVTIEVLNEDPDTGKIKKMKESHLVDGKGPTEVEKKVMQAMDGTLGDWKIVDMKISKISCIY